jgi:hypothetical protein
LFCTKAISRITIRQKNGAALGKLKGIVPFGLATGNHDNGFKGSADLILNLEFGPSASVIQWAQQIIDQHPDHLIIYNTHAYMYADETRMSPERNHHWLPQNYGLGKDLRDPALHGEGMWEHLIRNNKQSFLVVSGHVLLDGVGTLVSVNDHQEAVYQMLANFQSGVQGSENGGNGYLRILKFYPKAERIVVETYSPYTRQYKNTPDHAFEFNGVRFDRSKKAN